jgi:hypothetical protein
VSVEEVPPADQPRLLSRRPQAVLPVLDQPQGLRQRRGHERREREEHRVVVELLEVPAGLDHLVGEAEHLAAGIAVEAPEPDAEAARGLDRAVGEVRDAVGCREEVAVAEERAATDLLVVAVADEGALRGILAR